MLGRILHLRGDAAGAVECYERAREIAARAGDEFAERIALNQIGWSRIAAGEPQPELFTRALELSLRLRNEDGDAYALEGLAGSAAVVGDVERAGFLLGAAEALRARTGLHEQRSYVTYQSFVDAVLATDRAAEFEARGSSVAGCRDVPCWRSPSTPRRWRPPRGARVRRRCRRERGHPVMNGPSGPAAIRTPDQRLRVFVSSTLKELEPERRAARAAIEQLRLAPVMFELGARPHPPRELYRAYLGQSDVFVGIYWQQYGWIAPGEEISGLEDEYRLAPREMPKLIYVKQPAEREERLTELMSRIRDDGTASYTPFSTADELADLIAADLATLLAERFDASRAGDAAAAASAAVAPTGRIPAPYTDAVGREFEVTGAAHLAGRGRAAPRHPRRPRRDRQEPPRDRGRAQRRRAVRPA